MCTRRSGLKIQLEVHLVEYYKGLGAYERLSKVRGVARPLIVVGFHFWGPNLGRTGENDDVEPKNYLLRLIVNRFVLLF